MIAADGIKPDKEALLKWLLVNESPGRP